MSTAYIRGMKFELAAPVDVYVAPIVFGEDMTRQCREERALAVLLDEIFGPECERVHDASGAPVVLSRGRRVEAEVSISHSMHYAAVAVGSPGYEVGKTHHCNSREKIKSLPAHHHPLQYPE